MEMCPIGPLQETLLLHALSTEDLASTLQQHIVKLTSMYDYKYLITACKQVVDEQPSLRVQLRNGPNGFVITPVDATEVVFENQDFDGTDSAIRGRRLEEFLGDDRQRAFDPEKPFCRFTLIQFSPTSAVLIWTVSSLLVDRSSVGIVLRRIFEYWNRHSVVPLNPGEAWLKVCQWSLQDTDPSSGDMEGYWRTYLKGVEASSWLPRPAEDVEQAEGLVNTVRLELDTETVKRLAELASVQELDWVTIAESTWALLIQRYCSKSNVLFAVERDYRDESRKNLAGVFANILLRRMEVPKQTSMMEWLRREQAHSSDLMAYGKLSLSRVVRSAGLERNSAWLTSLVRVENPGIEQCLERTATLSESTVETKYEVPGVPVVATMSIEERVSIGLITDSHKVDDFTASQILRHWRRLLDQLAYNPFLAAEELTVLSNSERTLIVQKWNQTETPYSSDKCVHHLFARQATLTPDRKAVSTGSDSLSYRRLDALSDALAESLATMGINSDSCVAICLPRSLELPVAVLGVLKAGGAYLPIDPVYPKDRITYMLEDSGTKVVITQHKIQELLGLTNTPVLNLESVWELSESFSNFNPPQGASPEQLAYVLYTSGSTGRPKGVAMVHRALVNLVEWQNGISSGLPQGARTLQFSALSFDVSFQEMFATWCSGGELVLITEEIRHNPAALWHCISEHAVNRIFLPFVALQQLAEAAASQEILPDCLREVITAGEQLQITPQVVQMFHRLRRASLHNQYGPSETHVVTSLTLQGDPSGWPALPSIGRPIANARGYILDGSRNPVPVGGVGEIYIGGNALARGYLNRAEMTAERFIQDPFDGAADARMYRTGDLGRFRPDGDIEFLGRADDQVKIRGFRVELAEVEAALRQEPSIRDCVVNAWKYQGENRLVAYVLISSSDEFNEGGVREQLRLRMPDYLCPSFYLVVDRLPLTPSGKVNRRALPEPSLERSPLLVRFEPPQNAVEKTIMNIWQKVLGISSVSRNDRFFDLGGTSLLMIRVHRKLEEDFAKRFPITLLFQHPTVASLAARLDGPDRMDDSRQRELQERAERQRQAMMRRAGGQSLLRRRDV